MTTTRQSRADFPGLDAVERWAHEGEGEVDPDALADLRGAVAAAALGGDRERLLALGDRLGPLAAALDRRLRAAHVERWIVQAAGASTLAAVIRGALGALDRARPAEALSRIPLGLPILRALAAGEAAPGDYARLDLTRLAEALDGETPSKSRLSRALTALEVAGFVHLAGATRSRVVSLLPLAREALPGRAPPDRPAAESSPPADAEPSRPATDHPASSAPPVHRVELQPVAAFRAAVAAA